MLPAELPAFVGALPKAELHLHIEGTLEPELAFGDRRAQRIDTALRVGRRTAFRVPVLQPAGVPGRLLRLRRRAPRNPATFYDLTWAYLVRARADNVRHAEIFFDPQTHTARVCGVRHRGRRHLPGVGRCAREARDDVAPDPVFFCAHLDEADAFETLEAAMLHRDRIVGVGLDSGERGNPPSKFARVFRRAREAGFVPVAHAGEEGPAEYVREALEILDVRRIDHGNHALDDPALVDELVRRRIPLTVCPLSNLKLCVVDDMASHPLKRMLDLGLFVTVNSDDPAYFGGYVNDNYVAVAKALDLDRQDLAQIARNSIEASLLDDADKERLTGLLGPCGVVGARLSRRRARPRPYPRGEQLRIDRPGRRRIGTGHRRTSCRSSRLATWSSRSGTWHVRRPSTTACWAYPSSPGRRALTP